MTEDEEFELDLWMALAETLGMHLQKHLPQPWPIQVRGTMDLLNHKLTGEPLDEGLLAEVVTDDMTHLARLNGCTCSPVVEQIPDDGGTHVTVHHHASCELYDPKERRAV